MAQFLSPPFFSFEFLSSTAFSLLLPLLLLLPFYWLNSKSCACKIWKERKGRGEERGRGRGHGRRRRFRPPLKSIEEGRRGGKGRFSFPPSLPPFPLGAVKGGFGKLFSHPLFSVFREKGKQTFEEASSPLCMPAAVSIINLISFYPLVSGSRNENLWDSTENVLLKNCALIGRMTSYPSKNVFFFITLHHACTGLTNFVFRRYFRG